MDGTQARTTATTISGSAYRKVSVSFSRPLQRSLLVILLTAATTIGAIAIPGAPSGEQPALAASESAVGVGTFESTAGSVSYTGKWKTLKSGSDSDGSSKYLNSAGSATFSFTGTAVRWVSRVTTSAGIADVYLDGKKVSTIDRYSSTEAYQQVVFERTGLSSGSHSLKLVRTGRSNPKSSGKNLLVDSFVVPDLIAPARPSGFQAGSGTSGSASLSWNSVGSSDLSGYRVYTVTSGGRTVVGTTDQATTRFTAIGLPADTRLALAVTAVDSTGNESGLSTSSTVSTGASPAGAYRYSACPAASKVVHNASELMAAVKSAKAGSVIRMASGTYRGQIDLSARGTAAKPIWVCGPRSAVVDTGTVRDNHGIMISNSSDLIVTGMTVRNALKGVTVRSSRSVTVSDIRIHTIGYEGIHLRENTTDSTVVGNQISDTGQRDSFYGEGIYIGSSEANWCSLTSCQPDRSDRNAIVGNTIWGTGSDPVEAKEGTSSGVIRGNQLSGLGAMRSAEAWVKVKGNGWSIIDNNGSDSSQNGFRLQGSSSGWGVRNVFSNNRASVNGSGYGFSVYEPNGGGSSKTIVSCNNVVTRAAGGFTDSACTP